MLMLLLVIALCGAAIALPSTNWWRERRAREEAQRALDALSATDIEHLPGPVEFGARFGSALSDYTGHAPTSDFILKLSGVAADLYAAEGFTTASPLVPPARYDSLDGPNMSRHCAGRIAADPQPGIRASRGR